MFFEKKKKENTKIVVINLIQTVFIRHAGPEREYDQIQLEFSDCITKSHSELSLPAGSSVAPLQILLQKRDPRASGRTQTGLQVRQERERMEGVREVTISLI